MTQTRKSLLSVILSCALVLAGFVGVNALIPASPAHAAYTEVMTNGDTPNRQMVTSVPEDKSNSFEHTMYFTAQGSDGQTVTSNYASSSPSVPDSVLNLDQMTKGADGYYHFNAVIEMTAEKDVANLLYDIVTPSANQGADNPHVQFMGEPTFSGANAAAVQAATEYSNTSNPGTYAKADQYKAQYGDTMPNVYYMYVHGPLTAGQKLTVTIPLALTNADDLDLTNTSNPVMMSEDLGGYGVLPWGLYLRSGLSAAGLRFAKTDSAAYSPFWPGYDALKNNTLGFVYTVNNQISTNTSLDYTYTDVPQIPNSVVGLDASDLSYKNADESGYTSVADMIAQNKPAYSRNGMYRLNLAKVKKAYDGTGWSTNGMFTEFYTYTSARMGLVIRGSEDSDVAQSGQPFINVELWHYLSTAQNICLTVGDTFNAAQGINWVRPYNQAEVRDPLNNDVQKKLIDVTYTDAQGNDVSAPDTSKPGKYTVTYRYYNANNDGTRSTVSTTSTTRLYITAEKAASCPPEETATVSYDANAGEGTVPSQSVTYTDDKPGSATLSNGAELSREGYLLSGWNTEADGSGTAHALGSELTGVNSDVTLYAQWTKSQANIRIDESKLVDLDPCTYSEDAVINAISGVYGDDGSEITWNKSDVEIDTSKVDFTKDGTYPLTVTYTKGTKAYPNGLSVTINYTISGVAGCVVPADNGSNGANKAAAKTVPTSSTGASLAKTGSDIVGFATTAAVLIVLGGSMILMRRTDKE